MGKIKPDVLDKIKQLDIVIENCKLFIPEQTWQNSRTGEIIKVVAIEKNKIIFEDCKTGLEYDFKFKKGD